MPVDSPENEECTVHVVFHKESHHTNRDAIDNLFHQFPQYSLFQNRKPEEKTRSKNSEITQKVGKNSIMKPEQQ